MARTIMTPSGVMGPTGTAQGVMTQPPLLQAGGATESPVARINNPTSNGVMRWVQTQFQSLLTTVGQLSTFAVTNLSHAPVQNQDGMVKLARAPWWPVTGQTKDAWVYYDGVLGQWQYLDYSSPAAGPAIPQGRLSASASTPLYANAESSSTVYYVPYNGNKVWLYNGTSWAQYTLPASISNNIADGTVNPAAMGGSQSSPLFLWNKGGTITLTRGPAQASSSTTDPDITWVAGMPLNTSAITNGPPALNGLYVGSISTYPSGAIYYMRNITSAAGGDADHLLQLRNFFNQLPINLGMPPIGFSSSTINTWVPIQARLWITKLLGADNIILGAHAQAGGWSTAPANVYIGVARQANTGALLMRAAAVGTAVDDFGVTQPWEMTQQAENLVSVFYSGGGAGTWTISADVTPNITAQVMG